MTSIFFAAFFLLSSIGVLHQHQIDKRAKVQQQVLQELNKVSKQNKKHLSYAKPLASTVLIDGVEFMDLSEKKHA